VALKTPTNREAVLTGDVAAIWQRTLNLPTQVAVDANFVALGGDSLLLMAILDEVEETYGIELDVEAVLADLTVAGMVRAMVAASDTGSAGA